MVTALSIAGSDSIGGAGIQADIKAMTALGVHATTVITAVTAQNTCRVDGIHAVPSEFIAAQLRSVLEDADVRAAKTGMLYCAEAVHTVADLWPSHIPLVVDPVLVAGVGDPLYHEDLVDAIRRRLLPIATVVTPNRMEAETLAGIAIDDRDDALEACRILGGKGASVLLKGGHMDGEKVVDIFYSRGEHSFLEYPRLERAGHGGGCTLASYIASHLALGHPLDDSIRLSRVLIQRSIASMFSVGKGERLVDSTAPWRKRLAEAEARLSLERSKEHLPAFRDLPVQSLQVVQAYGCFPTLDDFVFLSADGDAWHGHADVPAPNLLQTLQACRRMDSDIQAVASMDLASDSDLPSTKPLSSMTDASSLVSNRDGGLPELIYKKKNDHSGISLMAMGRDAPEALRRLIGWW